MTYSDVKNTFLNRHTEFKKSPFSNHVTSCVKIDNEDLHVFYSSDSIIKGIEIFSPLFPIWNNIRLGSRILLDICQELDKINIQFNETDDSSGICIKDLGVSLFCQDYNDSKECMVDSAYVSFIIEDRFK